MPIKRRSICCAAMQILADPMNGSQTMSCGFEKALTNGTNDSIGFWLGWCVLPLYGNSITLRMVAWAFGVPFDNTYACSWWRATCPVEEGYRLINVRCSATRKPASRHAQRNHSARVYPQNETQ